MQADGIERKSSQGHKVDVENSTIRLVVQSRAQTLMNCTTTFKHQSVPLIV